MMMMFFICVYIHKRMLAKNREHKNNQSSNGIRIDRHGPPAKFHHITRFVNKHQRFTTGWDVRTQYQANFMYMYVCTYIRMYVCKHTGQKAHTYIRYKSH